MVPCSLSGFQRRWSRPGRGHSHVRGGSAPEAELEMQNLPLQCLDGLFLTYLKAEFIEGQAHILREVAHLSCECRLAGLPTWPGLVSQGLGRPALPPHPGGQQWAPFTLPVSVLQSF